MPRVLAQMKHIDWTAWIATIALIIVFREGAVLISTYFQQPELGNLLGLLSLLAALLLWRKLKKNSASTGRHQQ